MAHSSQDSTASECSSVKESKEECEVDIWTPAVVAWAADHAKLQLQVQYDPQSKTAFFKLRDSLVLKASSPAKTHLYLFMAPEQIRSLTLDTSPDPDSIPPATAQLLDSTFTCLRITLKTPADLIGPKFMGLTPKNRVEGQVLDQLRSLGQAIEFSIFMPHQVASKAELLSVCQGIRDGFKSHPGQTDLACLYQGKGGMKIVAASSGPPNAQSEIPHPPSGEHPPSYSEAGPSPPPAAAGPSSEPASKKRRRNSSEPAGVGADLVAVIEATCRKIVQQEVRAEIRGLEKRLTDKMELLADKYAEKQGERLADDVKGASQAIDEKVDDEFYGLRIRLEDFIKEEMAEAEERIVEHLQSTASVHLEFGS